VTRRPRVAHLATVDLTHRFLLLGQLRRLRDEGFDVTAISAPGPWTADLEKEGILHIPWPHATRAWSPGDDLRALGELVGILRRMRFDVVHTHTPKPGLIGRVAARMVGVPCVVNTVHGFFATPEDRFPKRSAVLGLEWVASRFSDLELYQSEEDLRWARRTGVARRGRSVLLGNGTDLSRFDPDGLPAGDPLSLRASLGIPPDAPVVGTIGRLVEEKGYRELFDAAREVRARMPDAWFVALGDSDTDKDGAIGAEEMAAQGDRFLFPGWQEDVRPYLAMMDLFVLPSWREGLPRSAVEAAAMGRPLVLTDIRGCREVVSDGVEGVLVPPRNAASLTEAIVRLLEDPDLREKMGAAARATALERFDERRVADTVVRSYRELLGSRGFLVERAGEVLIRRAGPGDLSDLARLHREIPGSFLPTLGDAFLRRLYRGMLADPNAVVLVAGVPGGKTVGFVSGVRSVGPFYRRFFLRHGIQAAVAAAPRLVRRGVLRRARESASYPEGVTALPEAELLSIAVDPAWRSKAVGAALVVRLLDAMKDRGVPEVKVVVAGANDGANRFYERLGFRRRATTAVHRGEQSNVLVIETNGRQPVGTGTPAGRSPGRG
jgi:glycosyltransferase involved in cell wall biosynthesis/ribosomal protein S18 acetylase RimI-like enzyme